MTLKNPRFTSAEKTGVVAARDDGVMVFVEPHHREWGDLSKVATDYEPPPPDPITAADISRERDRRLAADFDFQGVRYQRDPLSVQRIAGAAQLATLALAQGAQPGDLRWHGGAGDFGWIASDDSVTPMDAPTVIDFARAAAGRETALIFAARTLRHMDPIPDDYADDKWWP